MSQSIFRQLTNDDIEMVSGGEIVSSTVSTLTNDQARALSAFFQTSGTVDPQGSLDAAANFVKTLM
ncbi:hypothetical protein [Glaciimonas immobilis]|uniref:Bacteriocin n=1 Tax=Glaciimonas immobilis TaxID=728004 RepID=A0A840RU50_9BURK|nr:hypothetical protein [Glaciimonas immobilis]KAF3997134.1 hypothetical protein HAV38_15850 [Glaciimonas immobilis]MBB5199999.1 hypothetical protein [Glaciimonas immobilis]